MKPSTVANMLALTVDEQMEMLVEDPSHIRDMLETIQRLTAAAEQHRALCPMLMTDAEVEAQLRAAGFDMPRVGRQGDLAQLCARLAVQVDTLTAELAQARADHADDLAACRCDRMCRCERAATAIALEDAVLAWWASNRPSCWMPSEFVAALEASRAARAEREVTSPSDRAAKGTP